jgi:hypothetical protein
MCHSDTYQRKTVADPASTETVTNILGQVKTYVFGKVDSQGNYTTEPDYAKMPAGTSMVNLARTVHLPTTKSCLRCHATAGDWTSAAIWGLIPNATVAQDVTSQNSANLTCASCHAPKSPVGGRNRLRAADNAPTCKTCHASASRQNAEPACANRSAARHVISKHLPRAGDEMSGLENRLDAFLLRVRGLYRRSEQSNVKPEYVWFDGTSYVYNVEKHHSIRGHLCHGQGQWRAVRRPFVHRSDKAAYDLIPCMKAARSSAGDQLDVHDRQF